MCSLATFQKPPPLGYVTLREHNSDLIAVDAHQIDQTLVSQVSFTRFKICDNQRMRNYFIFLQTHIIRAQFTP